MGVIMIVTDDDVESLTTAWRTRWGGDPIAYELRVRHIDRWVHFHSLPRSKRYAETEDEYEIIRLKAPGTIIDSRSVGRP